MIPRIVFSSSSNSSAISATAFPLMHFFIIVNVSDSHKRLISASGIKEIFEQFPETQQQE